MTVFLIAFGILGVSHLTVDTDFPPEVKSGASVVFGILGFLYLILEVLI